MKTIDLIIPTYKPGSEFEELIKRIYAQTVQVQKIIIMNTDEEYWNSKWEEMFPKLEVHHVTRQEFNHGKTRKTAASFSDADILLYMTQDALPAHKEMTENLLKALEQDPAIGSAYARQLPKADCGFLERYTRSFNYPEVSVVKWKKDVQNYGIKTYFCSNVCAAYKRDIFEKLGGFVERAIFNEDMIYAGKVIQAGYGIAYAADARVFHSHNYTALQQFHRNFDLGVSQAEHPEVFAGIASEGEGIALVKKSMLYLLKKGKVYLIFDLILQSGCKYAGYLLGKNFRKLPKKWILKFTLMPEYWNKQDI